MKNTLLTVWSIIIAFGMIYSLIEWSILIYQSYTWGGKWWEHVTDLAYFWIVLYTIYKLGRFMEKEKCSASKEK